MTDTAPPRPRRLGLAQTLSLLLAGQATLATLAMAAVMAITLRHGFTAYLRERDRETLRAFAAIAGEILATQTGALDQPGQLDLKPVLDRLALARGLAPPHPPAFGARPAGLPPGPDGTTFRAPPPGLPAFGPPGLGPPGFGQPGFGPPPGNDFGARVSLFTPGGAWLAGMNRVLPPDADSEPVFAGGRHVATARLLPEPAPMGADIGFLQSQYRGIAATALGLLVISAAGGTLAARRAIRPLRAVRQATHRIAGGDFAARLRPDGPRELALMAADINEMAQALERLERSRRQWLADISHELRTPLTVLAGELEAIADGIRPLDQPAIASLRDEVGALAALIEDLHLLATADLGRLPCHMTPLEPRDVAQHNLARFATAAAARGLALSLDCPPDTGEACWDPRRIDQMLGNLLGNSLRYTNAPGIVRLGVEADRAEIRFVVEDSAPGPSADELTRLAQPFVRGTVGQRARGGTGLGLAVVAAIAAAHHGALRLAASPLGGLRVTVALPRHPETTART